MYEDVDQNWMHGGSDNPGPGPQPALTGPGIYMGLKLAPVGTRILRGLVTYGPGLLLSIFAAASGAGFLFFLFLFASWAYYLVTFEYEGQQSFGGRLTGTRVVYVSQEGNQVRVRYPNWPQLIIRVITFIVVDGSLGWIKLIVSPRNRSIGDTLARTVVIFEGQVTPELPYAKPRRGILEIFRS